MLADLHDELALWGQFLHAMVLPIRDPDVVIFIDGNSPGLIELSITAAGFTAFGDELPVFCEEVGENG
jgi:hypothetical protein